MGLFSTEERRGLLWILPLGLLALLLVFCLERYDMSEPSPETENVVNEVAVEEPIAKDSICLKPFNPNTFEYEELRDAGVPVEVAVGIVRWRSYGKVYRIKEDLALVKGVNDSIYAVLKPYIIIDRELAPRQRYENKESREMVDSVRFQRRRRETIELQPFMIDTASARYLYLLGFSHRQADVIVRYVKMLGGLRGEGELRDCYVISDSMADRILPYVVFVLKDRDDEFAPLEINSVDTMALRGLYGIGAKSAYEIVRYRELLGGYHSIEQIRELKCITYENYRRFFDKIYCDSCKISKIDINFASPKILMRHPYISSQALRRIVKQRQLKGGWSRIEEMVDENILTEEEARRLAPYLRFRLRAPEKVSEDSMQGVSRTKRHKREKGRDTVE